MLCQSHARQMEHHPRFCIQPSCLIPINFSCQGKFTKNEGKSQKLTDICLFSYQAILKRKNTRNWVCVYICVSVYTAMKHASTKPQTPPIFKIHPRLSCLPTVSSNHYPDFFPNFWVFNTVRHFSSLLIWTYESKTLTNLDWKSTYPFFTIIIMHLLFCSSMTFICPLRLHWIFICWHLIKHWDLLKPALRR